jgi:small-conductance mechanosensitive channel
MQNGQKRGIETVTLEHISQVVQQATGLSPVLQQKIVSSLFVLLILWLIRLVVYRLIARYSREVFRQYRLRKIFTYNFVAIGILVLARVWFEGFSSITTFLGLFSAGMAIALKDLLINIAGWVFIVWRKPFDVGDRIQLGKEQGDVIDLRLFQFTILEIGNWVDADQSTGRVIHIPNARVFSDPLANYNRPFQHIWNEIGILITFESNWEKARDLLREIIDNYSEGVSEQMAEQIRQASEKFMIYFTKLTPAVYTSVKDSGVMLTIRYLTRPQRRRGGENEIWQAVLREFARHDDIDFAYPTTRFYDNTSEGKQGLQP